MRLNGRYTLWILDGILFYSNTLKLRAPYKPYSRTRAKCYLFTSSLHLWIRALLWYTGAGCTYGVFTLLETSQDLQWTRAGKALTHNKDTKKITKTNIYLYFLDVLP